jgi:hypothetical protein
LALVAVSREIAPKARCRSADPDGKHPGRRPTKRTPKLIARIAEAISFGLTNEEASAIVGIDDDTLTEWNKVPEFSGAVKSAVANRKLSRKSRDGRVAWPISQQMRRPATPIVMPTTILLKFGLVILRVTELADPSTVNPQRFALGDYLP